MFSINEMTAKRILLLLILFIVLFSISFSKCSAQDTGRCWDCPYVAPDTVVKIVVIGHIKRDTVSWVPMWVITNLEYVTIRNITGKHKLFHVKYMVLRRGCYYFPNMSPVQVLNYKVKDAPEVFVKK